MVKFSSALALAIAAIAHTASAVYIPTGNLTKPEPMPYTPAGGNGTSPSDIPYYHTLSDFDYESFTLALYQEWIELDLFRYGLQKFSVQEFADAGLNENDRYLIQFMSDQEIGHANLISNILGPTAAKQCTYTYPFTTVRGFIDFCQKLTKWGESGVYGFLGHLDSRASASLLLQSITTEARQQLIFRQFEGLFAMPVWFEPGIPQSWAWTLLAPYITSCPSGTPRLSWQNFPALNITNNPDPTNPFVAPAISAVRNKSLSYPGRRIELSWEKPGKSIGPDQSYKTNTTATGAGKYVAWVSQLNVTYTPLTVYNGSSTTGYTYQPNGTVFPPKGGYPNGTYTGEKIDPVVNGTMFIAITDDNVFLTPFNLSLINPHVVAGPAMYQAD